MYKIGGAVNNRYAKFEYKGMETSVVGLFYKYARNNCFITQPT